MPQYLPSILARSLFAAALFTASACVVGAAPAGKSIDPSTDVSTPTSRTTSTPNQTFYFGRYSIQVPTTGVDTWSSYKLIDTNITLVSRDGRRDLPGKVSAAIAEINKLHASGYPAYERTENLDGGGAIVLAKSARYDLDVYYLTAGNAVYRQVVKSISPRSVDKALALAKEINALIHTRKPAEAPPAGSFAVESGYVVLPADRFEEQVSIGLPVSSLPGIHLNFDTRRIGRTEPGLLSRVDQRSGNLPGALGKIGARATVLRRAAREVAGLPFEEVLLKTSVDGRSVYAFRLEYPGSPESSMAPYTVLELSTLDQGATFARDQDALRFWDDMVASMKRF